MLTFYDSGIGGLTVVKEYLKVNPNANFHYYADLDILPMGDKSKEQIVSQIKTVAAKVFQNSDLMILACNTAGVNTIRELQQNWLPKHFPSKQILSISKPITELLESRYFKFKDKKLIILATQATTDSDFYQKEFEQIGFQNVLAVACPGLCDLIESVVAECLPFQKASQFLSRVEIVKILALTEKPKREAILIQEYLKNLNLPQHCLILLACTHYPIIKDTIAAIYPSCTLIDPSKFIATRLVDYQSRHLEH
jgi:glutamate racemase